MSRTSFQWSQSNSGVTAGFNSMQGNMFMSSPHGMSSYGIKMQGQNLHRGAVHESFIGPQSIAFQMQSSQNYPHG
uniref:Syringolide-induced protein 1-3-1B n=1 Tax=Rhizophora mucronata TaxID=61149 RepID=A0A2P2K0G7_RHIMU